MATAKRQLTKQQQLTLEHKEYLKRLKAEPKVKVRVDKIYKQYIGPKFTWLLNGEPVTIHCDGVWREYPESIAQRIYEKLDMISESNKEIKEESKIFG